MSLTRVVRCYETCIYEYLVDLPPELADGADTAEVHEWMNHNDGWDESTLVEITDRSIIDVLPAPEQLGTPTLTKS